MAGYQNKRINKDLYPFACAAKCRTDRTLSSRWKTEMNWLMLRTGCRTVLHNTCNRYCKNPTVRRLGVPKRYLVCKCGIVLVSQIVAPMKFSIYFDSFTSVLLFEMFRLFYRVKTRSVFILMDENMDEKTL